MKAFKIVLVALLFLVNFGQASMRAAPSELFYTYLGFVFDFIVNGASRTIGPNLPNDVLSDFGTFASRMYPHLVLRDPIWASTSLQYNQATLDAIMRDLKSDKYLRSEIIREAPPDHSSLLEQVGKVVMSTRGSTAPGFSDTWNDQFPEFKRALAGTLAARQQDMFRTSLADLFQAKFPGKTLVGSKFFVLDTDVAFSRQNWGLTARANGDNIGTLKTYKTWSLGLPKLEDTSGMTDTIKNALHFYQDHYGWAETIARTLSALDSVDSCKAK
ncbi:uncharacterized protein BO72DRAFT_444361 [Aspergillus fijiensis CBS 313.89]|uniref:Uncharacterized protein n=1 Tax=Aspergillus fijiensis CBS 313.89 TaxID=1448319 RepID=A0A8G1S3K9_9EURO|nr:uncharacterized protein BO72DRAFT_444361 [Aspergillus fijiensis CBS 313.89]RAK81861.1 hypothetical protein BO72DRAFT_444361 [Aspergillus fijiensis CBS 313.89]